MRQLDARLAALEKRNAPPARVFVCMCAEHNGFVNLPPGEHLPGCPALAARDGDNVIRVVYGDAQPDEM